MASTQPTVVLVRPEGPLNVGLVARACANFEASLRVVDCRADLASVEFRMTSVHAEHVVASMKHYDRLDEALDDLDWVLGTCGTQRDPRLAVLGPRDVAPTARARAAGRVGIVFGNEAHGLDNDELRQCAAYVHIPASARQPSLNLSHAVAVMLATYAFDSPSMPSSRTYEAASRAQLEVLRETWLDLARLSNYFDRADERRFPWSLERMFRRLPLYRADVNTMMGLLRHVRDLLIDRV